VNDADAVVVEICLWQGFQVRAIVKRSGCKDISMAKGRDEVLTLPPVLSLSLRLFMFH
jgi:hypothetical protein